MWLWRKLQRINYAGSGVVLDYFQIFGLDVNFTIDVTHLSEIYQTLQKTVHPDKFAHASQQEQLIAVKKSTLINDAYQTLKSPLKRAEYILNVREVPLPNEQASFSDNMFLMRQMELREMLADIKSAGDVDAAIFEANQVLDVEFEQLYNALQIQLSENTQESNQKASENLRKLKFYQKLNIELERLEDTLFDD